jgi:histidyl-tRNA synthetase
MTAWPSRSVEGGHLAWVSPWGWTAVDVFVVSEVPPSDALIAASLLRREGLRVDLDSEGRSVKTQFRSASRSGAPITVVLRALDQAIDVRFEDGQRVEMPLEELPGWVKARLA